MTFLDFVLITEVPPSIPTLYMVSVLYETGCRPEEFRQFSKSNFTNNYTKIDFITAKQHTAVSYNLSIGTANFCNVFLNTWGNNPTFWRTYSQLKRDYLSSTEQKFLTSSGHEALYYLRYCYVASRMLEGKTELEIKNLLGHTNIETTRIYMQKAQAIINQI